VARSRHKNAVERHRCGHPDGIVLPWGRLDEPNCHGRAGGRPDQAGGAREWKAGGSVGTAVRQAGMKRTAWEGCRAGDRRVAGRHGCGDPWPRRGQHEGGPWPRGRSWGAPLEAGAQADYRQQALAAGRTRVPRAEGWPPGLGGMALRGRGGRRRGGGVRRQDALEVAQEGPRDGAP
jgi:hypothetical protein